MMPYFTQKPQVVGGRWLRFLLPSMWITISVIATLVPGSLATAAGCQFSEESAALKEMSTGEWPSSLVVPPSITTQLECFCGFAPSMNNSRIVMTHMENQELTIIGACLNLNNPKTRISIRSMLVPVSKSNSSIPAMKVSTLAYNGKKQVLKTRTVPVEITPAVADNTSTFIGPVQESQNSNLSEVGSPAQSLAMAPPRDNAPFPFLDHLLETVSPFQNTMQLTNNESHLMNLMTARAVHGRDCVSECP